jgi:very-long-chain enoyl-CoA reductase
LSGGCLTSIRVPHSIDTGGGSKVCAVPPRAHNLVSYSVALLVFVAVAGVRVAVTAASVPLAVVIAGALWCLHFARRAAESAAVHRYGKRRVPASDVVIEYAYYWGFAAWNAISLTSAGYRAPSAVLLAAGIGVFALAELGNAKAHRMLRDLRPSGTTRRVIPRGFLFERVSCPHYLFEIGSWIGFALVAQTWAALSFLLVGAGILASWARSRHVAYCKDFDGRDGRELYPPERRALIPGIF